MTYNDTPKKKSKRNGSKTATQTKLLSTSDNALRETMEYMEREAGGRVPLVQALAQSRNPAAKALVLALGKIENDEKSVFEVALTIKKDPYQLAKAFSEGLQLQNITESANKLFRNLPDIMESTIEVAKAKSKDGHADRKMLFSIAGLLPEKGGLSISFNQNFQGVIATENPAAGTHDLLHTDPFEDAIDVTPEDNDD